MQNLLKHLKYQFDRKELLETYYLNKKNSITYKELRGFIEEFKITKIDDTEYIKKIKKDFSIPNAKPRFYTLKENTFLPNHIDNNTKCSINVLLSDENAPITIEGIDFLYDQCLLNTQKIHSVKNTQKERILFKLSIFDLSFEEVSDLNLKFIL